jgi:hypothetical protein
LILVDADGNVRGTYLSTEGDAMKKLIADAQAVAKEAKGSKAALAGGAR